MKGGSSADGRGRAGCHANGHSDGKNDADSGDGNGDNSAGVGKECVVVASLSPHSRAILPTSAAPTQAPRTIAALLALPLREETSTMALTRGNRHRKEGEVDHDKNNRVVSCEVKCQSTTSSALQSPCVNPLSSQTCRQQEQHRYQPPPPLQQHERALQQRLLEQQQQQQQRQSQRHVPSLCPPPPSEDVLSRLFTVSLDETQSPQLLLQTAQFEQDIANRLRRMDGSNNSINSNGVGIGVGSSDSDDLDSDQDYDIVDLDFDVHSGDDADDGDDDDDGDAVPDRDNNKVAK